MPDTPDEARPGPPADLSGPPRQVLVRAILRSVLSVAVVVLIYFRIPLGDLSESRSITEFALGLLIVVVVLAWQGRLIVGSPYPLVRTVEALSTTLPLFVVLFATTHFEVGDLQPGSYTQPMTRLDSLYFTVTTFATVGYGDISPVSQGARLVSLMQMVLGLLLLGIVARAITGAAHLGLERRRAESTSPGSTSIT